MWWKAFDSDTSISQLQNAKLKPGRIIQRLENNARIKIVYDERATLKDCLHPWPHPAPYLNALDLNGFAPEVCPVIEAMPRGC
ncbi:MAG: hypothetical protein CVU71_05780 [Deltaproteobacteria bacterium HGW-Deltaproteobacteria-6]|jgi:beta-phosphoglucomutase-like phosphatase (HAD superfamily)|nr:MAG: hypothetical protein CVU71_05780 [Deltaproteobacteria bacterium HGW-Deltaproteobacteria-6]